MKKYFDVDNFDDYLKMLDICTDITGRKDLYDKTASELSKVKKDYNAKLAVVPDGGKDFELVVEEKGL